MSVNLSHDEDTSPGVPVEKLKQGANRAVEEMTATILEMLQQQSKQLEEVKENLLELKDRVDANNRKITSMSGQVDLIHLEGKNNMLRMTDMENRCLNRHDITSSVLGRLPFQISDKGDPKATD